MSTQTPTRIPQPTRLLHPSSSPSTKKLILSPKIWSSPSALPKRSSVPRYQLQDPGVTPGSPKVIKRMTIRPPGTGGTKAIGSGIGIPDVRTTMNTEQGPDITPTKRAVPSASLWSKSRSSSDTASIPNSGRGPHREPIPPSTSASTTPTRIPIPRPRITPTRAGPTTSKSYLPPSPAISISATVATAPSTPRSSIPITTSRSRIPLPVSPAISIAATVATVSPCPRDASELFRDGSEMGSEMECESIYSSASALALARYRASLPSLDNVITSTGYDHELSRMSSTTSFSSASSLARHRISQLHSLSSSSKSTQPEVGQSVPMSANTTNTEDMALVWQPDPESTGSDPAANLWMEIEARLNRGKVGVGVGEGMTDERGQWVLTRQRKCQVQDRQVVSQKEVDDRDCDRDDPKADEDLGEEREDWNEKWMRSEEMRKESSEFTVSAYFDPDLSTPIAPPLSDSFTSRSSSHVGRENETGRGVDMEGTAILNMSAPLIASSSSTSGSGLNVGATPANTPLIHHETIQRVSRVRKSHSGSSSGSRSGSIRLTSISMSSSSSTRNRSDSSSAIVNFNPINREQIPESIPMVDDSSYPSYDRDYEDGEVGDEGQDGQLMTRLDSHVQAALELLSDNTDSPSSIILDADVHAQSSCLEKYQDGEDGTSPYIELDETTPMPIPIPYQHTPTPSHAGYQSRPNVSEDYSTPSAEEVGLGIGMNLHLDSIYSLPVLSPRLVRGETNHSSSTSECSGGYQSTDSSSVGPMSSETSMSSRGESQDSYEYQYSNPVRKPLVEICERKEEVDDEEEEEEEMLTVTDLDTGYRVDLSIKRLDELWKI